MELIEVERNHWIFQDPAITYETHQKLDLALDAWETGHVGSAEKMLLAIVTECPNHIDALHHLSLIYDEQGRELEAYVFCQTAVSIGLQAIPGKFEWEHSILEWSMLDNRPFMRLSIDSFTNLEVPFSPDQQYQFHQTRVGPAC